MGLPEPGGSPGTCSDSPRFIPEKCHVGLASTPTTNQFRSTMKLTIPFRNSHSCHMSKSQGTFRLPSAWIVCAAVDELGRQSVFGQRYYLKNGAIFRWAMQPRSLELLTTVLIDESTLGRR